MYLLYGMGISNISIKRYFDLVNIPYRVYCDNNNESFNLDDVSTVIKSSGIKNDTLLLSLCKQNKIKVISDVELFYKLNRPKYVIAVSGSNGKTTVTSILGELLKEEGYLIGGNIGIPVFDLMDKSNKKYIIECSSYMLEYIDMFKPNIYVLLNIEKHHLDHHLTFVNYLKAKLKPLKNMTSHDYVVYPSDDILLSRILKTYCVNKVGYYDDDNIELDVNKLNLIGNHNILNIKAVFKVLKILDLNNSHKIKALYEIQPLSHRLEKFFVSSYPLVLFINDSKSTNVHSLKVAIEGVSRFYKDKTIHLIVGGMKINQEFSLAKIELSKINNVYCFGCSGKSYYEYTNKKHNWYETLKELLNNFSSLNLTKDDLVLFSPGAPSQDEFKSFEERGIFFKNYFDVRKDKS